MITNFKLYELNIWKPEIGDYVICKGEYSENNSKFQNHIINNIGVLYDRLNSFYRINYDDYDDYVSYNQLYITIYEDILYWSKDKKELEMILTTNKFNI